MKQFAVYSIIILQSVCYAQNSNIDSLEKILVKAGNDTTKVNIQNALAVAYGSSEGKKSKKLADEALQLSKKLKYYKGAGIASVVHAWHLNHEDAKAEAIKKLTEARKYFIKARDKTRQLEVLREKTKIERLVGDFDAMYRDYVEMDSLSRKIKRYTVHDSCPSRIGERI
ncbi:MAG: hypothetical protein ACHQF2_04840 [Flavobacteriales bacterium]